ncbi:hypothetical protein BDZ91DRAFT_711766 [Kalaharituber pfeilii]|nr:hypothetical protein BDZ91DRAFT_711766 [Kalaharituber pfeilii]
MERVWEENQRTVKAFAAKHEKQEAIERWIDGTTEPHKQSSGPRSFESWSMQRVIEENKLVAVRFAEELQEKLQRRKYEILHHNYVQDPPMANEQTPGSANSLKNTAHDVPEGRCVSAADQSTIQNSVREYSPHREGDQQRKSKESYDEYNIEDLKYLYPNGSKLHSELPGIELGSVLKEKVLSNTLTSPTTPIIGAHSFESPPQARFSAPSPSESSRSSSGYIQATSIKPIVPLSCLVESPNCDICTATMMAVSAGDNTSTTVTPKENQGFSFRRIFGSRAKTSKEALPRSTTSQPHVSHIHPHHVVPEPANVLRKQHSITNLKSTSPPIMSTPREDPLNFPDQILAQEIAIADDMSSHLNCRHGQRRMPMHSLDLSGKEDDMEQEAGNKAMLQPPPALAGVILRGKDSMVFNGKVVREVPKGAEDPVLEQQADKGEPF